MSNPWWQCLCILFPMANCSGNSPSPSLWTSSWFAPFLSGSTLVDCHQTPRLSFPWFSAQPNLDCASNPKSCKSLHKLYADASPPTHLCHVQIDGTKGISHEDHCGILGGGYQQHVSHQSCVLSPQPSSCRTTRKW